MNKQFVSHVISLVMSIEALFLLVTSFVAFIYKESVFWTYLLYAIVVLIVGYLGVRRKPESNVFYAKEGFISVGLSWVVMSIVGAIPFYLTKEIPSFVNCLFETVSGFTTTGATILKDIEALSHASLFWRSFTHWLGGMGVLVFVLMVLPLAGSYGMYILKAESPGPQVGKFVAKMSSTAKILYTIYLSLTIVEFICLVSFKMPVFDAINATFQTAGTGGFAIYNQGMSVLPVCQQNILTVFMILFGINFNVYYFILIGKAKDAFKCEELRIYLGIILLSVLLISINTLHIYQNIKTSIQVAFFQVASIITTTGFSTVDFNTWPELSKTILLILMFIGACAGSTGGGLKVSRIAIIFKSIRNTLQKFTHPRVVKEIKFEGKVVDDETVISIKNYLMIFVIIFFGSVLILSLDNFDFTSNFSAVAATINNIGPGLNVVGPTENYECFSDLSKFVMMFDMLVGRLEIIPMVVLFLPSSYKGSIS